SRAARMRIAASWGSDAAVEAMATEAALVDFQVVRNARDGRAHLPRATGQTEERRIDPSEHALGELQEVFDLHLGMHRVEVPEAAADAEAADHRHRPQAHEQDAEPERVRDGRRAGLVDRGAREQMPLQKSLAGEVPDRLFLEDGRAG